jgi:hypothetical protein
MNGTSGHPSEAAQLPAAPRELVRLRDGSVVDGRIADLKESWNVRGGTAFTLFYEFTLPDKQALRNFVLISKSEFKSARVGDPLLIIYDPSRPGPRSVPYRYADYCIRDFKV